MTGVAIPTSQSERYRARADETRLTLLRVLAASGPLDAHVLAEHVGLHVNTVRWHLGVLIKARFVSEEPSPSSGRGRPRRRYSLVEGSLEDESGGFRLLAEVLLDALELDGQPTIEAVEEAGRRRGETLIRSPQGTQNANTRQAITEILRLLDGFGFQPRLQREPGGQRIAMRPCPFGRTAVEHSSLVCPAHLGLVRGALNALGAPIEAISIEPFAKRDLCLVHLARHQRVHNPS